MNTQGPEYATRNVSTYSTNGLTNHRGLDAKEEVTSHMTSCTWACCAAWGVGKPQETCSN